ncbi:MAG: hypothetical protein AB7R89_19075 [Dehalococcoidia bacterium]
MTDSASVPHRQEVYLHRRIAILRPDRIDVRPARGAVIAPLLGLIAGLVSAVVIWIGLPVLPLWLLAILLIVAIIAIPFAGIGTVYALVGAHVVVDRTKQSATWQQGFLGMGVGTTELVPFWKVDRILIEEAGASDEDSGQPLEEFAQWRIILLKKSGKRLDIGVASGPQALRDEAFGRAWAVADAIATMADAALDVYQPGDAASEIQETDGDVSDTMSRKDHLDTRSAHSDPGPSDATDAASEVRA